MREGPPFIFGFVGALGVLLAYVLVQAVLSARSVLILIVVAMFLAVGLDPMVQAMVRRGLRRGVAITIVSLGVLAVFVGFGAAVLPPLVEQTTEFAQTIPGYLADLETNERVRS
jgi:predicted PurR-regulated permease PerM